LSTQRLDAHAAALDARVRNAVTAGTLATHRNRRRIFGEDYADSDALRAAGAAIRQHALDHLDEYLPAAEAALVAHGVRVHYARDARRASDVVLDILRAAGVTRVVKAKSMVSEEAGLAARLAGAGISCVESDLGELIVQLDGDHPSHIVRPIIHRDRAGIAATFARHGLGDHDEDPQTITLRARRFLRERFFSAQASLSGANFVSAESGRVVVLTNEGNNRFGAAAAPLHVVVTSIDKVVPTDRDLGVLLALLPRSATGQRATTYVELIGGPRPANRPSGPEVVQVVFVDHFRSDILGSEWHEILRCIRCGACMNACPVYREASGHAYRGVYPGPLGAVVEPLLGDAAHYAERVDLARASSLCGACADVCPVQIPLPDLLVRHRERATRERLAAANAATPPMGGYAFLASSPRLWGLALHASRLLRFVPLARLRIPLLSAWLATRTLPDWRGGRFRAYMRRRRGG
jgi:L-lactate dehydrogenase complex protein LldF